MVWYERTMEAEWKEVVEAWKREVKEDSTRATLCIVYVFLALSDYDYTRVAYFRVVVVDSLNIVCVLLLVGGSGSDGGEIGWNGTL